MAVHRKRLLLRDPISGKRPRRRLLLLSALIVVGGLGVLTSAEAQEGSLSGGAATFVAGKFDSTVRLMTGVLQGDNVPPADAAKALYFRGLAYQKLGQHTRAIADLGAAMWLGLSSSERTVALVNRSLAYQAAGLKTQAEAELASARKIGSSGEVEKLLASNGGTGSDAGSINSPFATEVRTESGRTSTVASARQDAPLPPAPAPPNAQAANPGSWTTTQGEAPASPPPSSGNRLSRWWGSVRGSSSEPEPAPAPAPAPESAPRATAAAVPSAWTTQTQPEAGAAPGTRVATASPTAPVSPGGGGNYLLQLSPTRSEAEASALWKTVVKQNQQLASLQPRVEKTDMGNLGTFYRLQIGPFPDKAESLKLCNALKRSGVDCFLVNP